MKVVFITVLLCCFFAHPILNRSYASIHDPIESKSVTQALSSDKMDVRQAILTTTPKKFRQLTGRKMNVKEWLSLQIAKKVVKRSIIKKQKEYVSQSLYIVLAILGLGFIGMGVNTDWTGSDWVICLLLSLFTCIGGLIFALIKMRDYY